MLAAQMGVFFHRNRLNPYKKIIGLTVSLRRLMINFQRRKPVVLMRSPIFSSSVTLLVAVIRLSQLHRPKPLLFCGMKQPMAIDPTMA